MTAEANCPVEVYEFFHNEVYEFFYYENPICIYCSCTTHLVSEASLQDQN